MYVSQLFAMTCSGVVAKLCEDGLLEVCKHFALRVVELLANVAIDTSEGPAVVS